MPKSDIIPEILVKETVIQEISYILREIETRPILDVVRLLKARRSKMMDTLNNSFS